MKIMIGEYEISITARYHRNEKANKADTMHFLNELAIAFFEASEFNNKMTCYATGRDFKAKSDEIHEILEKNGCYKDCK